MDFRSNTARHDLMHEKCPKEAIEAFHITRTAMEVKEKKKRNRNNEQGLFRRAKCLLSSAVESMDKRIEKEGMTEENKLCLAYCLYLQAFAMCCLDEWEDARPISQRAYTLRSCNLGANGCTVRSALQLVHIHNALGLNLWDVEKFHYEAYEMHKQLGPDEYCGAFAKLVSTLEKYFKSRRLAALQVDIFEYLKKTVNDLKERVDRCGVDFCDSNAEMIDELLARAEFEDVTFQELKEYRSFARCFYTKWWLSIRDTKELFKTKEKVIFRLIELCDGRECAPLKTKRREEALLLLHRKRESALFRLLDEREREDLHCSIRRLANSLSVREEDAIERVSKQGRGNEIVAYNAEVMYDNPKQTETTP